MEQRVSIRRNDSEMQFSVLKTSEERRWAGFTATIYNTSGGFTQTPSFANHNVSMHLGTPIQAICRCDGLTHYRLQIPGDVDVIPAGFGGAWEVDGPTRILVIGLTHALLRSAAEGMGYNLDRISMAPQFELRDPQLAHIGWALTAELEMSEPYGRLYADSLGLALAAHILRRYESSLPGRIQNGLPKRRLQQVTDFIHDHLADDLPLAALANIARVSPSHFKVLFKQALGLPVHQYVVRCRVEYAIDLLMRDAAPLCDVALQAGFSDQSHMARWIRRITGKVPSGLINGPT